MHYAVEDIVDRRVSPDDGSVEYRVRWAGYDAAQDSWEPRDNVTESCASLVQAVDQRHMEETDARIDAWRRARGLSAHRPIGSAPPKPQGSARTEEAGGRKRSRSPSGGADGAEVEVLAGVVRRGPRPAPPSAAAAMSVVMLGEVILAEEAAAALSHPAKRGGRRSTAAHRAGGAVSEATAGLCAEAVAMERAWRERFGISLAHSCVSSGRCTGAREGFVMAVDDTVAQAERERAVGKIEILGLAPVEAVASGRPFVQPVSFVPWIGESEAERLRRDTVQEHSSLAAQAQDVLRPQREQMVVRYVLTEEVSVDDAEETRESSSSQGLVGDAAPSTEVHRADRPLESAQQSIVRRRVVTSMPLSVFRLVFPQLLLDYLLDHAVVLEEAGEP